MTEHQTATTLCARGLTRRFGNHAAVEDASFEVRRGEVLGFLGPNGAGKTTTMHMLTGNLAPTRGSISVCGIDLLEEPTRAKAKIGYLPEIPPLYRELSVDEYLTLAARLHRIERGARAAAVGRARNRCGLAEVGRKLIGALSKGYQQRVGIAQAIVHDPEVLILDEPTAGLDPNQIREIRSLIRELGGRHSVILSTHILPEVEAVCDRVQIMHHGRLVYSDTIGALEKFHSGRALLVGLRRPPPESALAAIAGVTAVERAGETVFRVRCADGADPAEEIARCAVAGNWGLYELTRAQTTLEEVFVQLTRSEALAA